MLRHIHIQDFAIIDEVELELGPGLTVLTGETGAGKSILIDAVGLVLGDRADAGAVRHGCSRAEITASFDISSLPGVQTWLADQELDADGECLIRRTLSSEGGSRAYVNGHAITLQNLRQLGERLVDIHGQHEHQSLLRRPVQREILDFHGGHQTLLHEVAGLFTQWDKLRHEFEGLQRERQDRDARLDLLRYQVSELEALGLGPDETESLDLEHRRLSHGAELAAGTQEVLNVIYDMDEGSVQEHLGHAIHRLESLERLDPALGESRRMLAEAEIQVQEAADSLRHYLSDVEVDPARQAWVERRIGDIQELARKHRLQPGELPGHLQSLTRQLEALENADITLGEMAAQLEAHRAEYLEAARRLSASRLRAAKSINNRITTLIGELGMGGGQFEATIATDEASAFRPEGLDSVQFRVSANPGQPIKPLSKVASGGELSRIGLAIQVAAADSARIPTIIFDEVDAGIGGRVAEIVGRRLRGLGETRQVLCVTHLPQVASQSHAHIRVTKLSDGKTTRTKLTTLSADEKVEEIARMLGGVKITARTREHAVEMIKNAGR